jgi:solute carrier family 25 (mitochondrial aspartate/glutamate transporter), member 12/13
MDREGTLYWTALGAIGFVGGFCGQSAIYPLDTLKTRFQSQSAVASERVYSSYAQCFRSIVRVEGALGLYRGLFAVAALTSPEKALKFTANDFARSVLRRRNDGNGKLPWRYEMAAGAFAGFAQVLITCPMEIVKIRMQMEGQKSGRQSQGILRTARALGARGLFQGTTATWMRDIPFSLIYFPLFHHWKRKVLEEKGELTLVDRGIIPTVAGTIAGCTVTPADVIKTRMQGPDAKALYTGTIDCIRKTYRAEGFAAFWSGLAPRFLIRGPQFGVSLFVIELLQSLVFGSVESER